MTDARHRSALAALVLCALGPTAVLAQEPVDDPPVPQTYDWHEDIPLPAETEWGTPVDREATEQIRSWTTREEFLPPILDYLPENPAVTSPSEHFGYAMGKPGVLHRLEELYGYYERLAEDSERVNLVTLDRTTEEGNEFKLLQIGEPDHLDDLERIKEGMNALADPRETAEEEARALIDELPVIYMVYTGLHSAETAHPNMAVELAYRLAVAEHPRIQETLENVVVFLAPVAEPDGLNRMVDWYRLHGEDVYDDGAGSIPRAPWWGAYAGHDNNRNALQLYLELSKQWLDVFLEWKHPISLDVHEAGSVVYHYFSTGTGPYNEYIDPLTIKEWQWMANFESNALERGGMPGVYVHDFYDGWWPGYLFWITNNRNAIGRFTETWGGMSGLPNTRVRQASPGAISREWFRPNPGDAETHWSFRNQINYQQAGVLETLRWASENREAVLDQFWVKSNNSLERGRSEAPNAYVIPEDQERSADVSYMLNLIAKHGIEVHRAQASGDYGGVSVSEGDYVLRMDQPYRDFAHMLMDVQNYPDESEQVAYIRGGMAWTFPLMHNVEAREVDDPGVLDLAMGQVDEVRIAGTVVADGNPDRYAVHPEASAKSVKAAYELEDVAAEVARDPLQVGGTSLQAGAWLLPGDMDRGRLDAWAAEFGMDVHGVSDAELGGVAREELTLPRVALLHTWRETRDSGAVRYSLDYLDIPYEMLAETALADGDLRERFDVILFPEQGRPATGEQIFRGIDDRHSPMPYRASEEHPSLGFPNETDDVTGGMGFEGLQALRNFVEDGGTFITLGSATTLPVDFSLTREVTRFEPDELIIPGAIVRGEVVDPSDPLTFGYGDEIPLWHKFGPYITTAGGSQASTPIRYPEDPDELFLSGVVVEPAEVSGRPALASHPMGEGHMVLFGFNPMHRYQPHGNFALVWNAILHWDQL